MEIYDLYSDLFNLGDKRDTLKVGNVITDPTSGDDYLIVDTDNMGEYFVIERIKYGWIETDILLFPFTSNYLGEEYIIQYCSWDEKWYAWGTQFNVSLNDDNLEDLISRFKSLISFFAHE